MTDEELRQHLKESKAAQERANRLFRWRVTYVGITTLGAFLLYLAIVGVGHYPPPDDRLSLEARLAMEAALDATYTLSPMVHYPKALGIAAMAVIVVIVFYFNEDYDA